MAKVRDMPGSDPEPFPWPCGGCVCPDALGFCETWLCDEMAEYEVMRARRARAKRGEG